MAGNGTVFLPWEEMRVIRYWHRETKNRDKDAHIPSQLKDFDNKK